jgi:hypothetical protein
MYNETHTQSLVDRFFELLSIDNPTKLQQAETQTIIADLGFSDQDLRDLAAQCARRAIYLNNTTQKV